MKEEDKIFKRCGRKSPYKVPEGYFEGLSEEISGRLPEYPEMPVRADMTRWHRLKPYLYLAAMFAGIWCMMKVFHHASSIGEVSLDNPPAKIAAFMGSDDSESYIMLPSSETDADLLNDVSEGYTSIEDFEKDFGYNLEPRFDNIEIDPVDLKP